MHPQFRLKASISLQCDLLNIVICISKTSYILNLSYHVSINPSVYNSLTSIAHSLRTIPSEDCGTSQAAQGRTNPHKDAQVEFDGYVRGWRRQRPGKARGRTRLHRDAQSCTDSHKIAQSLTNANKIAQFRSNAHNTAQKARERVFLSEKWCHSAA